MKMTIDNEHLEDISHEITKIRLTDEKGNIWQISDSPNGLQIMSLGSLIIERKSPMMKITPSQEWNSVIWLE